MVSIYIIFIILIILFGVIATFLLGVRKHYFYLFFTAVHIFYFLNTPIYRHFQDDYKIINVDVSDYYPFGFKIFLVYLILFNLFYFSTPYNSHKLYLVKTQKKNSLNKFIFNFFLLLYLLIFINTLIGGVNLVDVLIGKSEKSTLGLPGASYYIQNLADSLITLLVAAYIFKVKKIYFFIMIIMAFFLFIILGFRYRLLLTIFAFFLYYISLKGIRLVYFFRYILFFILFVYSLLFITYNRVKLYSAKYDELTYDARSFNYDVFFDQAKGSLVDFAIYKALDTGVIKSDNGETLFLYIFIKMAPSFLFNDNKKPYPPPFFPDLDKSIGASRDIGEASTFLGSVFYAFSFYGILLVSALLGFLIKKLTIRERNDLIFLRNVMIVMALFQFYTRGYLPMFVDHLAYMFLPLILIRKYFLSIDLSR